MPESKSGALTNLATPQLSLTERVLASEARIIQGFLEKKQGLAFEFNEQVQSAGLRLKHLLLERVAHFAFIDFANAGFGQCLDKTNLQ